MSFKYLSTADFLLFILPESISPVNLLISDILKFSGLPLFWLKLTLNPGGNIF